MRSMAVGPRTGCALAAPSNRAAAITSAAFRPPGTAMIDYAVARANMVENQLRPSRIDDPGVLRRWATMPRERFVPAGLRGCAYGDEDLALGGGRFLIEPLALGKLLQAAVPRAAGRDAAARRCHRLCGRRAVAARRLGLLAVPPGGRRAGRGSC